MIGHKAVICLITYEGQTESPYSWTASNYSMALSYLEELTGKYPNRKWAIEFKDVS